jgi:HEAT repeat protein
MTKLTTKAGRADPTLLAAARPAATALARDEAWWQRAYAAAALEAMPDLRTPDDVQRLRDDPNPVVRALAARLIPSTPLR